MRKLDLVIPLFCGMMCGYDMGKMVSYFGEGRYVMGAGFLVWMFVWIRLGIRYGVPKTFRYIMMDNGDLKLWYQHWLFMVWVRVNTVRASGDLVWWPFKWFRFGVDIGSREWGYLLWDYRDYFNRIYDRKYILYNSVYTHCDGRAMIVVKLIPKHKLPSRVRFGIDGVEEIAP